MAYDFSLQDVMGNFIGGAPGPAEPDMATTATTGAVVTPQITETKPGFINPKLALKNESVAPVADQAAYNAGIAQQESRGNANIGFHNKNLSSAYGPYGMTSAAYEDARRVNPSLPTDITQANPTQLTQAQNAFTQQNAKYLQSYGVPVNDNTLAAAHLLGAKGLKDYEDSGYLSPAAIKANGGEANLRNIVEARLGGQAGPASGAVNQTPPAPGQETAPITPEESARQTAYYGGGLKTPGGQTASQIRQDQGYHSILNSNSQEGIMQLAFDKTNMVPIDVQRAAQDKLARDGSTQDAINRANQKWKELQTSGDPRELTKLLNNKKEDRPSWVYAFQAIGYGLLGAKDKEKEAWDKFDPKIAYQQVTLDDGTQVLAKVNANTNETLAAWKNGQWITNSAELNDIAAKNTSLGKGVHVTKVVNKIDPKTGEEVNEQTLSDGKTRYMQGGVVFTGDKSRLTDADEYIKAEDRKVLAADTSLRKQIAVPTDQDRYNALRKAGVNPRRIESELGMPAGTLTGATTKITKGEQPTKIEQPPMQGQVQQPPMQGQVQQPPAPVVQTKPEVTLNAQPAPFEFRDQRPGEMNTKYEAEKKAALSTYNKQLENWQNKNKLQEKDAEAFVAKKDNIRNSLRRFEEAIDVIDRGEHHLGPQLQYGGSLPGVQQFVGEVYGSKEAMNTQEVRSLITRGGLEGIKDYMGPAISNFDVQTWMKNNPISERSDPETIKKWLIRTHDSMLATAETQRRNAVSHGLLEPSFKLGMPLETKSGVMAGGGENMTPADKARAELERRRKGTQ